MNDEQKKDFEPNVSLSSAQPEPEWMLPTYFFGGIFGLLSILLFYTTFKSGYRSSDFFVLLLDSIILGLISFSILSPWKRINYAIWGLLILAGSIWLLKNVNTEETIAIIWSCFLGLIGITLISRAFNTTIILSIKRFAQIPLVKRTLKILLWLAIISVGLLVFTGIFSFLAGLSATTIIIILLVLIFLKIK